MILDESGDNEVKDALIMRHHEPITLVGGGAFLHEDLEICRALAPILCAADGGGDALLARGLRPQAVFGDMDSLSPEGAADLADALRPIAEQDSTDFDKALRHIEAPLILGLGFLAPQMDHAMAALHSIARRAARRVILFGPADVIFHLPPAGAVTLNLPIGTRVSLFPLAPVICDAQGLQWPLHGLRLDPMGRIGTSNQSCAPQVILRADQAGLLVFLPKSALSAAISALLALA